IIKLCRDCIQIRDCFELIVRINSARSVYFKDDLKLLKEVKPNMIGMTKVESSSEVAKCKNFTGINIAFVAIETIHGHENRDEIVSKLVAGDRLIMGYEDVSSELQIERPSLQTLNPLSFILMNTIVTAKKY